MDELIGRSVRPISDHTYTPFAQGWSAYDEGRSGALTQSPGPCLTPRRQEPLKVEPSDQVYTPLPCSTLSSHSPSYRSPDAAHFNVPQPHIVPMCRGASWN